MPIDCSNKILGVRGVNSERHWREDIAVAAFTGREAKIADLVDYSCAVTSDFLRRGLVDEGLLNFGHLRDHYLDPSGSAKIPVPIDDVMAATFALTFLDISHRMLTWLYAEVLDWERWMIIISGQSGRPTAGLTWASNNMCHLLWQASGRRLPAERVFIAPHAPPLALSDLDNDRRAMEIETTFRHIWLRTRGSVELGRAMFEGYPAYRPSVEAGPFIDADTKTVDQMPAALALRSPRDRHPLAFCHGRSGTAHLQRSCPVCHRSTLRQRQPPLGSRHSRLHQRDLSALLMPAFLPPKKRLYDRCLYYEEGRPGL